MNEAILTKINRYFGAFQFAVFSEAKEQRWIVPARAKNLQYLKAMNAQGNHIFIRPMEQGRFMMADDLTLGALERFHMDKAGNWKPGRLIVETSPDNFQAWIRFDGPLHLDAKRYWLKKMGADPGADPNQRWGRSPAFRNRKAKYEMNGRYPLSTLVWVDWKTDAKRPPDPFPSTQTSPPQQHNIIRGGEVCHSHGGRTGDLSAVRRSDFFRGDESAADFSFALALMRRGADDQAVVSRIRSERQNWKNHKGERRMNDYLARTVLKAREVISASPGR